MTFLKAEWRKLAFANYAVNPEILQKYLPYKTEIEKWKNTCYVSLVGFMFLNTKALGVPFPFHINFEEVNLRFYVRYSENGISKRGVVFIKEIVPKPLLAFVARNFFRENYVTMPMQHIWKNEQQKHIIEYGWGHKNENTFQITADNNAYQLEPNSEEEYICEHQWGYTKINDATTSEIYVQHPRWFIYPTIDYSVRVNFGALYGEEFHFLENEKPVSVFLAEGSEVKVKTGQIIETISCYSLHTF